MLSGDTLAFVRDGLGSLWAVKLVVLLRREPARKWSEADIVRELRASSTIVHDLLPRFRKLGLVIDVAPGLWEWQPAAPELDARMKEVADAYAATPLAVVTAIAEGSGQNLRTLADAFRVRKD